MLRARNTCRVINRPSTHINLCYVTPCSRKMHSSLNIQRCLATPEAFKVVPATIGCMVAFTIGFPFDTFKVRLQNEQTRPNNLFSGFVPGVMLCGLYAFIYFYSYDIFIKSAFNISNAASISAVLALFVKVPCKVIIKTMQRYEINDMAEVIQKIYERNGLPGFFRGFLLYVLSDVPENIVKYNLFDFLLKLPFVLPTSITGALVGIVTSISIQPIDVLINIIMTNMNDRNIQFKKINYMKGLRLSLITNIIQSFAFYHIYHFLQYL